jgi:hypothetical protein
MGEQVAFKPEQHEALPIGGEHEIAAHTHEAPTAAELASEAEHRVKVAETSRDIVAESAASTNPVEAYQAQQAASEKVEPLPPSSSLKTTQSKQAIKRLQHRESAPSRALSKVIHQPAIRAVSETAGKTISRPSGLLGGGIVAFIGSSVYLYFTKHVGVPYNYFIFTLLFVGGFVFGLLLEFIVWSLTTARRRTDY